MKHIIACQGRQEYPKIFLFAHKPDMDSSMLTIGSGRMQFTLMVRHTEHIGKAEQPPASFQSIPVTNLLAGVQVYKGVIVREPQAEMALYQEIILDLASNEHIDPEEVAKRFDKITKLIALSASPYPAEARSARQMALVLAKRVLGEVK